MIVLPAIDIKDKTCVRLFKGDYGTAQKVAEDPFETAGKFAREGAKWIHMVDLNGAKDAYPVNREIFLKIAKETGLNTELGGGIRDMKTIEDYLREGISRIILGSAAVKNPDLVAEAVKEFGDKIAVGIDARDGMVATEGWMETSAVCYLELAMAMECRCYNSRMTPTKMKQLHMTGRDAVAIVVVVLVAAGVVVGDIFLPALA